MNKLYKRLALSGATGVVGAALIAAPAHACHPVGTIKKSVEDVTTSSTLTDANGVSTALVVDSGDTLQYVIKVSNTGQPAADGVNDMVNTALTDTLPAGIALASDPTQTTIAENLGTIKPGDSVTKTYAVKVTDTTDGDVITNKACFTGKSVNNSNNQSGCDTAVVKVHVPTPPTPPVTPTQPTVLPNTGAGNVLGIGGAAVVLGYAGYLLNAKRHAAQR